MHSNLPLLTELHEFPDSSFSLLGKGLILYHLNIQSILPKIDELRCTAVLSDKKADLLGFTETHLNTSINDTEIY